MTWRQRATWIVIATCCLASRAAAQGSPHVVRFVTDSAAGNEHWEGSVERLTRDSLYPRVRGSDTIAAFSRTAIHAVERERVASAGRWAAIGCLTVGGALGSLGYAGSHDPDSPGFENKVGILGLVVGCVVGGFTGAVLSSAHGRDWEPWAFPEEGMPVSPSAS